MIDAIEILPDPADKRHIDGNRNTKQDFEPIQFLFDAINLWHTASLALGHIRCPTGLPCFANF
jgi:hypothetical protein